MADIILKIIYSAILTGGILFLIGFIYGLYLVFKNGVDWPPEEK